jgi:septum site-determining protein MinD
MTCGLAQGECTLQQALIKDKRCDKLFLLAASQTKDKTVLTEEGVGKMLEVYLVKRE